jgi:hypothetical protein
MVCICDVMNSLIPYIVNLLTNVVTFVIILVLFLVIMQNCKTMHPQLLEVTTNKRGLGFSYWVIFAHSCSNMNVQYQYISLTIDQLD